MAQQLSCESNIMVVQAQYKNSLAIIKELREFISSNWKPTEIQAVAFKNLLKHLILNEGLRFDNRVLVRRACDYVATHRSKYHLDAFVTDEVVKITVELFFKDNVDNEKSKFRKMLIKHAQEDLQLDKLTAILVSNFWFKDKRPKPPYPLELLATIVLKRKIAKETGSKGGNKGSDTKFWKSIDVALDELVTKRGYGTDMKSENWQKWRKDIVDKDRMQYTATQLSGDAGDSDEEPEELPEENASISTGTPAAASSSESQAMSM
ncbi:hypothetical protein VKT23_010928 [Stygiomarasmius scandens]|uniref:Uncharacterized protein n=1 Tax=Marasmiellus scandens TaxID=2682957 RepID=A0ABR1JAL0_9AGAR